ncbi:ATP-dependent RNA helicase DBP3 [Friedmanniomyces simplex]|uniref:RNA helicase n=1 Tax=Friedmanniomyces simplex TaxID=329884 RepID=A0A4U0XZ36_9PEZI|nr:ATP-dependent RNA helicase DBP3 [Friedmanniomyces simplex]
MSKRSRDEAAAAEDPKEARREAKRLKKEKKAEKTEPSNEEDVAVPEQLDTALDVRRTAESAESLSKEERKALKRAKKDAANVSETHEVADTTSDQDATAKAERKALKHAEKAARKAAKSSKPEGGTTNGEATASNNDVAVASGREDVRESAYRDHNGLAALPQSDIDVFVAEKQLAIEDPQKQPCRPIIDFKYLPGDATQRAPFAKFSAPTPIQAACWPYLFAGRDVIGVAETGSGKTLAFGVPCVRYIASLPKTQRSGVKACMVSPTRELAMQIHEQLVKLAEPAGVKVVCVYGGMSKDEQRKTLKGAHVVVATPGRLNDFLQEGAIDLSGATYVVLDEADRMLDKGFEDEVRKIISTTAPTGRQTLMFTATWPPSVRELADTFMKEPVKVTIGENASGELRANARIVQEVEVTTQVDKQPRLIQLLKQYQSGKNKNDRILVFCLYKKEATRIEEFIRRRGFNVGGIHGDLSQQKRTESLEAFKLGKVPILVATDVAARGLDIPAVKLVINVTFPLTVEDYVHRIGRTGRAGQDGKAVTLFTDAEKHLAGGLINVLKAANQAVPEELMKFGTTVKKKGHDAYGAFYKDTADMKKATKITFD